MSPDTAFDLAVRLDAGIELAADRDEALVWYLHAALAGETRALLYLGQRYETGDGVPRNTALARDWYEAADDALPSATRRLEQLSYRAAKTLARPDLIDATVAASSEALILAWTSREQPAGTIYYLEVMEAETLSVLHAATHDLPAVRPNGALRRASCCARIHAIDPERKQYLASDWLMLARPEVADMRTLPAQISLSISGIDRDGLADDLAQDFRQSGVPVEIAAGPPAQARVAVRFRYETDRNAATSVARMMPGPFIAPSYVPVDRNAHHVPRPGLVEVTLLDRPSRG